MSEEGVREESKRAQEEKEGEFHAGEPEDRATARSEPPSSAPWRRASLTPTAQPELSAAPQPQPGPLCSAGSLKHHSLSHRESHTESGERGQTGGC